MDFLFSMVCIDEYDAVGAAIGRPYSDIVRID